MKRLLNRGEPRTKHEELAKALGFDLWTHPDTNERWAVLPDGVTPEEVSEKARPILGVMSLWEELYEGPPDELPNKPRPSLERWAKEDGLEEVLPRLTGGFKYNNIPIVYEAGTLQLVPGRIAVEMEHRGILNEPAPADPTIISRSPDGTIIRRTPPITAGVHYPTDVPLIKHEVI